MTILYIHGLQSSGKSRTADILRNRFPDIKVLSPDIPVTASEAISLIRRIVENEHVDLVIGTSMGGMLAQKVRGKAKILVNPSFHVSRSMRRKVGIVPFYSERADGQTEYEITEQMCDEFEQLESTQFDNLDKQERLNTFGVFGEGDDVVNCKDEYLQYYPNYITFEGSHRLTEKNIDDVIVPLIKYIRRSSCH